MRLRNLFTFIFVCICSNLNAQELLKIKGKVLTSDKKPVEYTTISLENKQDGVVIVEESTDANGIFNIQAKAGSYILVIKPLGYDTIKKKINMTASITDLGVFTVKTKQTVSLDAAIITAEKPIYKVELDKKVYDMANDLLSQGQTLSDVLTNVPSVSIDAEGYVSLRGNNNVKFLVDGKPSGMLGISDIRDALKNIPAENIERIELITNPSAKYEASGSASIIDYQASGSAGIINIVLKKSTNIGFNGSISVSGGFPKIAGANVNLNYKTNKFNIYTTLGSRYSNNQSNGESLLTNLSNGVVKGYRKLNSERDYIRRNYNVRLGGEYYLDRKNTFEGSIGYRYNNGNNINDSHYNYMNSNFLLINNNVQIEKIKKLDSNVDADINYKHEFDKNGHELSIAGRYFYEKEDENNISGLGKVNEIAYNQRLYNLVKQNTAVFTADYVKPIGEKSKLELGVRIDLNNIKIYRGDSTINSDGSETQNSAFLAGINNQQNVYSIYAQFGNFIGKKFQYFAGLRMESSDMKIDNYNTSKTNSKKYTDLFPTLVLNYKFTDKNEMQLSYSRKISRPEGNMLIPYFSSLNILDLEKGNPDLNPTYTNSLELSYIKTISKLIITSSLFYQKTTGLINNFQSYNWIKTESGNDYNKASEKMPVNAGNEDRYGIDITLTYKPFKWWNFMLNIDLFGYDRKGSYSTTINNYLNPDTGTTETKTISQSFNGNGFSSQGKLSSSFILPYDLKVQFVGNYIGGIKIAQQKIKKILYMDFSLSKDLLNKRASLTLNIRDVFNSRKRQTTNYYYDSQDHENMRWMKRSINLSFSYRFKNTYRNDKKRLEM